MKKFFFFAGIVLLLFACSKDKSLVTGENNLAAAHASGNRSLHDHDTVRISNTGFSPVNIKTSSGNTIVWINDDNIGHTVTSDNFDSGDIPPGGKFEWSFYAAGLYTYHCKYHFDKGTVTVPAGTY